MATVLLYNIGGARTSNICTISFAERLYNFCLLLNINEPFKSFYLGPVKWFIVLALIVLSKLSLHLVDLDIVAFYLISEGQYLLAVAMLVHLIFISIVVRRLITSTIADLWHFRDLLIVKALIQLSLFTLRFYVGREAIGVHHVSFVNHVVVILAVLFLVRTFEGVEIALGGLLSIASYILHSLKLDPHIMSLRCTIEASFRSLSRKVFHISDIFYIFDRTGCRYISKLLWFTLLLSLALKILL